ncbi:apolipoprotein A1/A4/E family protein [Microbacterium sp. SZ1]|uniref:apolipoprotein A1/A4/E family protein n=1 Tax=Microbacterium sp. SZ1 TaxID=1849736 RepID=UPI00211BB581|nr:apolipoprotein A1/A4/E family protein [Microbacterium sp. SZ1]
MLSAVGIVVTLGASMFVGFAWCVRRTDAVERRLNDRIDDVERKLSDRIDALDSRLNDRIDDVERKLGARIDDVERKLGARIDALGHETTEVKIAVARLEGPVPRLLTRTR